jgi:hypothetical protein
MLPGTRPFQPGDDVTDSSFVAVGQGSERCRDHLLVVARDVAHRAARHGQDPATIASRILAAWLPLGLEIRSADHDFEIHESTGVESFAFVVRHEGTEAGGVILRLDGEYPDSFESVALRGPGPHEPVEVQRVFFENASG